ncbi:MAG: AAA family ATPase [Rhodospirillales bacterium]
MQIEYVEIANYRKLLSVRVDLAKDKTIFVGANNSGKNVCYDGTATFSYWEIGVLSE